MKEKIAIIGGGIAGLTSAYLLNDKYSITLFEKDNRLGGNAYTYKASNGEVFDIAVAAFDKGAHKNFFKLLSKLKVKTGMCPNAYMSIYNLDTKKGFYMTFLSLKGLLAQKFAFFYPKNIITIFKLYFGIKKGIKLLDQGKLEGLTMREAFKLLPLLEGNALLLYMFCLCLLSSMFYEDIMNAPAKFFFGKMKHLKNLISPKTIYTTQSVKNFTQSYVNALASHFSDKIVLNSRIKSIYRSDDEVTLKMDEGNDQVFNRVILACNADQALELLEEPTDEEKRILGAWQYKNGPIVVHKDYSSFPKRELCQAFTYLYTERDGKIHTSVNGCLRYLTGVSNKCDFFSSQNANFPIKENLIEYKTIFRTPIFNTESVPTIKELPSLNGKMNSYYCGSHFGYGLHDDAVTSAIEVAKMLGIQWK